MKVRINKSRVEWKTVIYIVKTVFCSTFNTVKISLTEIKTTKPNINIVSSIKGMPVSSLFYQMTNCYRCLHFN